jgi:hypothetical protein
MLMEWEEYLRTKDMDAFKRMFAEMLLYTFNDILSKQWYQYHVMKVLKESSAESKRKINRHNEAIEWLLDESNNTRNLCFRTLNMMPIRKATILKALSIKFDSPKKFHKFFSSYAKSVGDCNCGRECYENAEQELKGNGSRPYKKKQRECGEDTDLDWLATELQADEEAREKAKAKKRRL